MNEIYMNKRGANRSIRSLARIKTTDVLSRAKELRSSPDGRHLEDVPLNGHVKLWEVDSHLDLVWAGLLVHVS